VKVFDRTSQRGLRRRFRTETELMQHVTAHEHCLLIFDAFEGPQYCHIVMEHCTCTILESYIKSVKGGCVVTEQDLGHAFQCMLSGVQHLHRCGIVHRDIKPDNLLLSKYYSLTQRPVVKVCDLGLSAKLPASGRLTEFCGTEPYMAPEILLRKESYSSQVDLWSAGVTAYALLLGDFPYSFP